MKEFLIAGWSWQASSPGVTAVSVDVIDEIAPGIKKNTRYEFSLSQRFETVSDEFTAAVRGVLVGAGLI